MGRCRFLRLLCICFLTIPALSAQEQYAYRIHFNNKSGSSSLNQPLDFLSQRSLDRRAQWNIAVDTTDLPVSPAYLDSVRDLSGGIIHVTSRWMNTCVVLVQDPGHITALQNKPYIASIELVGYFLQGLHQRQRIPADETFTGNGGHAKTAAGQSYYGAAWNQLNMVKGQCLHDRGLYGSGKLIAVLDDGFAYVNSGPAFQETYTNGRIADTYNFVHQTSDVYQHGSHGTTVLSTIVGNLPGTYIGAAPEASVALYITEDNTSEQPVEMDQMIAGMERADSIGADIISSSLGYNIFFGVAGYTITPQQMDGHSVFVTRAANLAATKGILLVISAGNEGAGGLLVPGDADSALTVGNVNVNGLPASNSGYGPNASMRVKPDVCAMGDPAAAMRDAQNILYISGTSMSTPQIAGYMACVLQGNPGVPLPDIKAAVRESSHRFANPGIQYGYGIPDFCKVWNSLAVGEDPPAPATGYRLFPNPARRGEPIYLQLFQPSLKAPFSYSIIDILGREIKRDFYEVPPAGEFSFPLPADLPSGLYFIKVNSGAQAEPIRLLVH